METFGFTRKKLTTKKLKRRKKIEILKVFPSYLFGFKSFEEFFNLR